MNLAGFLNVVKDYSNVSYIFPVFEIWEERIKERERKEGEEEEKKRKERKYMGLGP